MAQQPQPDEPMGEAASSSFPLSSPAFWQEAALVSTTVNAAKRRRLSPSRTPSPPSSPPRLGKADDAGRPQNFSETTLAYLPKRAELDASDAHGYLAGAEYAPNRFGDVGDYMRKKEIKVQTQNRDIALASAAAGLSQIFKDLSFYINGNTHPPMEELRKMILQRGGEVRPVLRSKGMVKFIIAPMLTLSKFKQFANYRVVREGWITESCKEGKLLDWSRWKLTVQGGWEEEGRKGMEGFFRSSQVPGAKDGAPKKEDNAKEEPAEPSVAPQQGRSPKTVVPASSTGLDASIRPSVARHSSRSTSTPAADPVTPSKRRPGYESTESDETIALITPAKPPAAPVHIRSAQSSVIPISPDANRDPSPSKPPLPPKVHKPEGAWEFYHTTESNEDAARLLKDREWRLKNTAERGNEGGFIDGYYQNSRLHHLSTWKAELKVLVASAQKQSEAISLVNLSTTSAVLPQYSLADAVLPLAARSTAEKGEKVIFHVDFDCFFVSCGLATRPHLKGKPAVVCHSQVGRAASSTSEIASASYEARAKGVKNGMSLGRARTLVGDDLQTIPYEFETYKKFSLAFYTVLMGYADELQAVSVDEALIDVTSAVAARAMQPEEARAAPDVQGAEESLMRDPAMEIADQIRDEVRGLTQGCEVSIGISHNILLAKLATRRAKPAGVYHLKLEEVPTFIAPLDVEEFPSIGFSIKGKIEEKFGSTKCGDLLEHNRRTFQAVLGPKTGEMVYGYLRGEDDRKLEPHKERKSISAEMNYGIRFQNDEQAEICVRDLAVEVSKRMKQVNARGRLLTLKLLKRHPDAPIEPPKFLGHGWCETYNKSAAIQNKGGVATDDADVLGIEAVRLLRMMRLDPVELRGVGIQITKLDGEKAPEVEREKGQGVLPFAKATTAKTEEAEEEIRAIDDLKTSGIPTEIPGPLAPKETRQSILPVLTKRPRVEETTPATRPPKVLKTGVKGDKVFEAIRVRQEAINREQERGEPVRQPSSSPPVAIDAPAVAPARRVTRSVSGAILQQTTEAGPSRAPTSSDGIDPNFLAALPPELRIEVKRDFARSRQGSEQLVAPAIANVAAEPPKPVGMHAAAHITRLLRPKVKTQMRAAAVADLPLYGAWAKVQGRDTEVVDFTNEVNDDMVSKYRTSELRELGLDPSVVAELPEDMQKEIVLEERRKLQQRKKLYRPADTSRLRAKEREVGRTSGMGRTVSRSPGRTSRAGSAGLAAQPRIAVSLPPKPTLLKATALTEVLSTVTKWIESRGPAPPAARDANKVKDYLVKCMKPEAGLAGPQNAVEVLKWMRVILEERWDPEGVELREAGREWWTVWRDMRQTCDEAMRARYGQSVRLY